MVKTLFSEVGQLAPCPFLPSRETRAAPVPVNVYGAFSNFMHCSRNGVRATSFSFWDGTLPKCGEQFFQEARVAFFGDSAAAAWLHEERQCRYDPSGLPWRSKPEYIASLAAHGRLPPGVAG